MSTGAAACACRLRLLGALTAAAALTFLGAAALTLKHRHENFGIHVTGVRVDASEAHDKALLTISAAVHSAALRSHSLGAESGWCDLVAGEERLLHGNLVGMQTSGRHERVFLFEVELVALRRTTYPEGPFSLVCQAEVAHHLVFRSGPTVWRSFRKEWPITDASLGTLIRHSHRFSWSLPGSNPHTAWPALASGNVQVRKERRLSLSLPPDLDLGRLLLQFPPVHIKASVSYAAGPVQLAVAADSPLHVTDGGNLLVLPVLLEANASLASLMSAMIKTPKRQALVLKPGNPRSALAGLLGQQHSLGLACDEEYCGHTAQHLGHEFARALSEGKGTESSSLLHQRLTWDDQTVARLDLAVEGGQQEMWMNASLVYRELDSLVKQDKSATTMRCILRLEPNGTGHLLTETQVQQDWSGEQPERQMSANASSSTMAAVLNFDPATRCANFSANLDLLAALIPSDTTNRPTAFDTSSDLYTLTVAFNLTTENGSLCEAHLTGPRTGLSFEWVVTPTEFGSRHDLSMASEPPHKVTGRWLAELATASPPPQMNQAEASSGQRRLQTAPTVSTASWYSVIAHHGPDRTCSPTTAARFVAQEEGYHVGVNNYMRPDANTSCHDGKFFGFVDVTLSLQCNVTSMVFTSSMYGFAGSECTGNPWTIQDEGRCKWNALGLEFDRIFCVGAIEDLPRETILYLRNGQVIDLNTSSTVGKNLPHNGLKDAVGLQMGIKTVLSFEVNTSEADTPTISGEIREQNTCRVLKGPGFERYKQEDWLPDSFEEDNPHCRLCELGGRALREWEPEAGRKELYDFCIKIRYTASCCGTTTWEESLSDAFDRFGLQVHPDTAVLGSASWLRNEPLQVYGNTTGDAFRVAMSRGSDTFLAATFDSRLWVDAPWMALNASMNWNGSNVTQVSGHASFQPASHVAGITGFQFASGFSTSTGSKPDFDANIRMESVASSTTRSLQFFTSIAGARLDAGSTFETSATGVATRSQQGLLLSGKAHVSAGGDAATGVKLMLGEDEEILLCAGSANINNHSVSLHSNFSKGPVTGLLQVKYESDGVVVAHGQGPLNKAGHVYAGEVTLNQEEENETSSLLLNVSDGFIQSDATTWDEFFATVSGKVGNLSGKLGLLAVAPQRSNGITSLKWDAQVTESVENSSTKEWLGGSASFTFPDPSASTTPPPSDTQEHRSQTTLHLALEDFAAQGLGYVVQKASQVFGIPMDHVSTACTVQTTYTSLATLTVVDAEKALAILFGLPTSSLTVQVQALGLANSTRVVGQALTEDLVHCKSVHTLLGYAVAIEAAHAMWGTSGTVSVEQATASAVVQLAFGEPEKAPPLELVREAMSPYDIYVDSILEVNATVEQISGSAIQTLNVLVAAALVVVQTLRLFVFTD